MWPEPGTPIGSAKRKSFLAPSRQEIAGWSLCYDRLSRWWSGLFFFFQAEDGIRDRNVTGVQTCALPISLGALLTVLGLALARLALTVFGLTLAGLFALRGLGALHLLHGLLHLLEGLLQIGRASCRERVGGGGGRGLSRAWGVGSCLSVSV